MSHIKFINQLLGKQWINEKTTKITITIND